MPAIKYEFGVFLLDPLRKSLRRGKRRVKITRTEFDLLHILVANFGKPLTRAEIRKMVWPDTAVDEGSVATYVFRVRSVLGQKRFGKKYIERVPNVGYEFVCPVQIITAEEVVDVDGDSGSKNSGDESAVTMVSYRHDAVFSDDTAFPRRHIKFANFITRSYGIMLGLALLLESSYAKNDFGLTTVLVAAAIAAMTAVISSIGLSLMRHAMEQDRPVRPFAVAFGGFALSGVISWTIAVGYLGDGREVRIVPHTTHPAFVALSVKYVLIVLMVLAFMTLPYYLVFVKYKRVLATEAAPKFFVYSAERLLSPWILMAIWPIVLLGILIWALRLGEKLGDSAVDSFLIIGVCLFVVYFLSSIIAVFWYKSIFDQAAERP